MIKLFLIMGLIFNPIILFAQFQGNYWLLGDSVSIQFDSITGIPTVGSFPIWHNNENYANISDNSGNLLFYLNGPTALSGCCNLNAKHCTIYNNNGNLMENGDSINTNFSMCAGTVILPFPDHVNEYFMIYMNAGIMGSYIQGLSYSKIDMSLNGGEGEVVEKNEYLLEGTFLSEKLAAVKHANGRDWWLISRSAVTNSFFEFLLTPSGISSPIEIQIGPQLADSINWGVNAAEMIFNNQGNKLAMAAEPWYNGIYVYDFDRCTGAITNEKHYGALLEPYYGCSFSPDDSKLYASYGTLHQFDLNNPDLNNYINLGDIATPLTMSSQHQLAPDGKIYISNIYINYGYQPSTYYDTTNKHLTVINQPNEIGTLCQLSLYSFYLGGHRSKMGLPNMPNYNLGPLIGSPCDTIIYCMVNQQTITTSICSGESYNFNGSTLTAAGVYADTLLNVGGCDSIISLLLSVISNTSSSNTASICSGDSIVVGSSIYYNTGVYADTLINNNGCDSIVTTMLTVDSVSAAVTAAADTLTATATGVGLTYQWINCDNNTNISGATQQTFIATTTGNYAVVATDANNCSKQSACVYVLISGYGLVVSGYEFSIFPNPTDGELTVVLRQAQHDKAEIEIIDVIGRIVERLPAWSADRLRTDYSSRNDIFVIDVSGLSSGVYFVKMQMSDGGFGVRKFVKE